MTSATSRRPVRRAGLLSVVVLATITGSVTTAAATVPSGRATIADARPALATTAADRGQTNQAITVNARVYLAGQDPAGLRAFDTAVSTPGDRDYGHYLTPAQYQARFGPSRAQTSAVESWLTSTGLTVTGTNDHYVSVRGSVGTAEQAFGTAIHNFTDHGATYYAPAGQLTVPAWVGSAVSAVTGLDNAPHLAKPAIADQAGTETANSVGPDDTLPGPFPVRFQPGPCSTYYGQDLATSEPTVNGTTAPWVNCGYTPQQMRSAYALNGLPTGQGQTVAIVDAYASPTITSDVTQYTSNHGTADLRSGQFTQNLPSGWNDVSNCGGNVWYVEESMDVDAVHTIAPDANIQFVSAASCQDADLEDALNRIVDNKLATIVSNSWEDTGTELDESAASRTVYDGIFQQAASEGIGMYFASGDCGSWNSGAWCGSSTGPGPSFPDSDPWVTAVGATTMELGSSGTPVLQTGWGNVTSSPTSDGTGWTPAPGSNYPSGFDGGSGGGTSQYYAQPSYQASKVPTSLSKTLLTGATESAPMRVEPDIALDGDDNTGMLVGETGTLKDGSTAYHETRWGGTSLATPLFAGIQAIVQQEVGTTLGFANPLLYGRPLSAITDVTDTPQGANTWLGVVHNKYADQNDPTSTVDTSLFTFGHDGELHATTGFDNVTGLGTPSSTYVESYNASPGSITH